MNLRIAYYVVAFAISHAAFAGAYGYASPAADAASCCQFARVAVNFAVRFRRGGLSNLSVKSDQSHGV